jgi:hypothetical protein
MLARHSDGLLAMCAQDVWVRFPEFKRSEAVANRFQQFGSAGTFIYPVEE